VEKNEIILKHTYTLDRICIHQCWDQKTASVPIENIPSGYFPNRN